MKRDGSPTRPLAFAASLLALALAASSASAQDAAARVLAQQGKALVDAGDYKRGCPKLEEAWRMDGQLLGAGFTLGDCYEREGKLASAWTVYSSVAGKAAARGEARAAEAQARADALKPRLTTLTVLVPASIASAPGLVVKVDGQPLAPSLFGTALPRDGGSVSITVSADGKPDWSRSLELPKEAGKVELAAQLGGAAEPAPEPATEPAASGPTFWRPLRIGGVVGVGVGAIGLGLGAAFGVLAMQRRDESNEAGGCDPETNLCASQAGVELRAGSRTFGDVSTAMFVVGGVAAAAGIVLLAIPLPESSSEAEPAQVGVALGPGLISLEGRFQ